LGMLASACPMARGLKEDLPRNGVKREHQQK